MQGSGCSAQVAHHNPRPKLWSCGDNHSTLCNSGTPRSSLSYDCDAPPPPHPPRPCTHPMGPAPVDGVLQTALWIGREQSGDQLSDPSGEGVEARDPRDRATREPSRATWSVCYPHLQWKLCIALLLFSMGDASCTILCLVLHIHLQLLVLPGQQRKKKEPGSTLYNHVYQVIPPARLKAQHAHRTRQLDKCCGTLNPIQSLW